MPEAIENYIPQTAVGQMQRRAYFVRSIALLLVAIWVFLILLAPVAEADSFTSVSNPLYNFFGFLCHQDSARSFHIHEHSFAVCARCFGVYLGLFFGFIIYPIIRSIKEIDSPPRFWLFLALIPIGVDWSLGVFGIWENTHLSRFITGAILGAMCAIFIIPALIELFALSASKKQVKRLSN